MLTPIPKISPWVLCSSSGPETKKVVFRVNVRADVLLRIFENEMNEYFLNYFLEEKEII